MWLCNVLVLWPVGTHTIPFRMLFLWRLMATYIYIHIVKNICKRCRLKPVKVFETGYEKQKKYMKTIVEGHKHTHVRTHVHFPHSCTCTCTCTCACLWVCCVVPCHVARRCSLCFVCRSWHVVSCRLSFVVLCSVVLFCCGLLLLSLRAFVGHWSVCVYPVRRPCAVLLAGCLRDQLNAKDPVFLLVNLWVTW